MSQVEAPRRIMRTAAPLREQAVVVIRDEIISNAYRPGDRLTEAALCELLGVSRTVVREALRQLESERLVEIVPNVGPVVAALTPAEAQHLYEVRGALESLAAELAAKNGSDLQFSRLRQVLFEIENLQEDDLAGVLNLKDQFYAALIDASGNSVIGELLSNVHARISQLRRITLETADRRPKMLSELRKLVSALETRDVELAVLASREHVIAAQQIALSGLPSKEILQPVTF